MYVWIVYFGVFGEWLVYFMSDVQFIVYAYLDLMIKFYSRIFLYSSKYLLFFCIVDTQFLDMIPFCNIFLFLKLFCHDYEQG